MVIEQISSDRDQSQRSRRRLTAVLLSLLALILLLILVLLLIGRNSSAPKNDLAISYRYPTTTLDWSGFKIHASSCHAVAGSSGFVSARVTGTAVVPDAGPGFVVVGQVETWILNASGHVIAKGKPWPLPKTSGHYHWTIGGFGESAQQPSYCIVQGINVGVPYDVPQSPAAASNAAVDPN